MAKTAYKVWTTLCTALFALGTAAPAIAWTDKSVRLIVPAPPGGTFDIVARALAAQLALEIGQPVLVENRAGAGGGIGVQALLSAPADGNVLLVTGNNVLVEIPHVMKTGFDPLKDVRPVTSVARAPLLMVAHPAVPAASLGEFITYARANRGKLSIANYSMGTASHYAAAILNRKAGIDLAYIPFAGSPPALAQVLGGQIPVMFDGAATSLQFVKAGKLKAFGVAAPKRYEYLPQVATFAELGHPEFEFDTWVGVVASAALAAEQVERINAVVQKAAAAPGVKERLAGAGFDLTPGGSPAQLAAQLRDEFERNLGIVKSYDIRLTQ